MTKFALAVIAIALSFLPSRQASALTCVNALTPLPVYRAGIQERRFEVFAAPQFAGRQRQSNWCWAATIQMVLNYHGVYVSQEQIVQRVFGNLVDRPAGSSEMIGVLNAWFPNIRASFSPVFATSADPRLSTEFLKSLDQGQPLIVALRGSSTGVPGHAYVLTGADFSPDPFGRGVIMQTVTLRDPWPMNESTKTISWMEFVENFMFAVNVFVPH